MKSSGKGVVQYTRLTGPSPIHKIERRCEFVDESGKRCDKYHHVKPWHEGTMRKYCAKHREYYAEIEANEILRRHPQYVKYL